MPDHEALAVTDLVALGAEVAGEGTVGLSAGAAEQPAIPSAPIAAAAANHPMSVKSATPAHPGRDHHHGKSFTFHPRSARPDGAATEAEPTSRWRRQSPPPGQRSGPLRRCPVHGAHAPPSGRPRSGCSPRAAWPPTTCGRSRPRGQLSQPMRCGRRGPTGWNSRQSRSPRRFRPARPRVAAAGPAEVAAAGYRRSGTTGVGWRGWAAWRPRQPAPAGLVERRRQTWYAVRQRRHRWPRRQRSARSRRVVPPQRGATRRRCVCSPTRQDGPPATRW